MSLLLLHTKVASSAALQLERPQLHHPTQCARPNRPYRILAICASGRLGSGDTNRLMLSLFDQVAAQLKLRTVAAGVSFRVVHGC